MKKQDLSFYLASSSPRRRELLSEVGIRFKTIIPGIDEKMLKNERPAAFVKRLAIEKAEAVRDRVLKVNSQALILSADTTVVAPSKKTVLEKPRSRLDAIRMVSEISGAIHTVLTAYCILKVSRNAKTQMHSRVVGTQVKMRRLSRRQIETYVSQGESMDKAGAYAAQGYGMGLIESIRGSYTNVVGLPICQVLMDLEMYFQWKK